MKANDILIGVAIAAAGVIVAGYVMNQFYDIGFIGAASDGFDM